MSPHSSSYRRHFIARRSKSFHSLFEPGRLRRYFGATNWPRSQFIVALDSMGSLSFTAVLS